MKQKIITLKSIVVLILISLFPLSSYATNIADYSSEFSNPGETCFPIDMFVYRELNSIFLNSNNYVERIPVIYGCCQNETCTYLFFDIQNKELLNENSTKEVTDLNYIKYQLLKGDLSEMYFVNSGLDVCSFYEGQVKQQTINLATDTAQIIAKGQKTNEAKQVLIAIKAARTFEIVSPFSIADFTAGIACHYNNEKIKKVVETLGKCNFYLRNIKNGFSESGYVSELDACADNAKSEL